MLRGEPIDERGESVIDDNTKHRRPKWCNLLFMTICKTLLMCDSEVIFFSYGQ